MAYTIPPDTRASGDAGHIGDHNDMSDVLSGVFSGEYNILNTAFSGGADPTGTNDSYAAIQAALNAAPAGTSVFVPAGIYLSSAQISVPPKVWLVGPQGYRAAASNFARIRAASGFTASSLLTFGTGTPCGGAQYLSLDGSLLTAGNSVNGIDILGPAKQGSLLGVVVKNFGGHGIYSAPATGNPDGWYLREISSSNNGGHGVYWTYSVDGQMEVAHLDNNALSGLALESVNNTTITNVKCQQNTQYGYYVVTSAGTQKAGAAFTACYSENNGYDGWYVSGSGGNSGGISWMGCWTRDDGTAGTIGSGYSGWNVDIPAVDLSWNGSGNYITSSTAGPDYGLKLTGATGEVAITGCSLIGSVAAYLDGGSNSVISWLGTTTASGQSDTRTAALPTADVAGPALGNPKPSDFGAVAWSFDPAGTQSSGGTTLTSGVIYLTAVFIPRPWTTVDVEYAVKTAATGVTAGENYVGIYNSAGTLLGSASIDTAITGTGYITTALAVTLTPGMYWVAWVVNATGSPVFDSSGGNGSASQMGLGAGAGQARFATNGTGNTTLPATITPASNSRTTGGLFAAVR